MKIHYLMRQLGIRSTATAIISVFWMSSIHALTASYIPETTPRPGEQRFSSFVFKATHNSYERNKPLDVQIDNYNVWQIELDCSWDTKDFGGIVVDHDCVGAKGRSLATVFDELNNSVTLNSRFTMIYMELKSKSIGQECREEWPSDNATYRDFIYDEIDTYLDVNRVYTPEEFLDRLAGIVRGQR